MGILGKLKKAFWISRPLFWVGPVAAYKAGLWAAGMPMGLLEWAELLLLSLPVSFLIYGTNDIYDIESDSRNPRKKSWIWGERLTRDDVQWVKSWGMAVMAVCMLVALSTLNLPHIVFAAGCIAIAYFYSAPPVRLKERPVLDSLAAMGYGFGVFGLAYTLGGSLDFIDWRLMLIFLTLSGVHAITTVMDMGEDRKLGVRTFATEYGGRAPALFAAAIFIANLGLAASYSYMAPTIALVAEVTLAFAAGLSLYVAAFPNQENAKLAFKLLIAYAMAWGWFLILHYFLLGEHFLQDELISAVPEIMRVR